MPSFLSDLRAGEMPAAVKTLQVLGAGVNGEAIDTESIWRDVQAIGFGIQILERGFIPQFALNAAELVYDRATDLVGHNHPVDLSCILAKSFLCLFRQIDVREIFGEAAMIVLIA